MLVIVDSCIDEKEKQTLFSFFYKENEIGILKRYQVGVSIGFNSIEEKDAHVISRQLKFI